MFRLNKVLPFFIVDCTNIGHVPDLNHSHPYDHKGLCDSNTVGEEVNGDTSQNITNNCDDEKQQAGGDEIVLVWPRGFEEFHVLCIWERGAKSR